MFLKYEPFGFIYFTQYEVVPEQLEEWVEVDEEQDGAGNELVPLDGSDQQQRL